MVASTTASTVDVSVTQLINSATTLADLDAAERRVLAEKPLHFASRLAKLENARSVVLDATDVAEADVAAWLAQLLWLVSGVELISSRTGGPLDPFDDMSKMPPTLFARAYAKAGACKHPVAKHVWLRALWAARERWRGQAAAFGLPRFDEFARECARAAAAAAAWHLSGNAPEASHGRMAAVFAWEAALESASAVGARDVLEDLLPLLRECSESLVEAEDFWAIRLLAAELKLYADRRFRDLGTSERLNKIEALASTIDAQLVPRGFSLDHMRVDVIDLQAELSRLRGAPIPHAQRALRRAEIKKASATAHPDPLVRATWWEEAAGLYQQASDAPAAAAAMEESRRAIEMANAGGRFKTIKYENTVSRAEVLQALRPYLDDATSAEDALLRVSSRFFVPWFDDPANRTQVGGFASMVLPRVSIVGSRVQAAEVSDGRDPPPGVVSEGVLREMSIETQLRLVPFFRELQTRFSDVGGSLMSIFCASPAVAEDDVPILVRAVTAFSERDYITVGHLLPARLEQIVHRTMRARGANATTRPPEGGLQERTFGALLHEARAAGVMESDFGHFVQLVLTEEQGLNLRNNIAHGWLPSRSFNEALIARLMHVALRLVRWSLEPPDAQVGRSAD